MPDSLHQADQRKNYATIHKHTGLVAPLDRVNVDTDQIVPKQFIKWLTREGYGRMLFYDWRYLPRRDAQPGFRAQCAALQGRIGAGGARQFRLRLQPRARAVGAP